MNIRLKLYTERYLVSALWYLAAIVSFWSFGYGRVQASDLWWHLANGQWIWEHRSIPLTDPYSFSAYGQRWLNHAWLSDLIYYIWIRMGGLYSLAWWKWTILIATFLFLMIALRRATGDWISSYLASLFALIVTAPFLDMRPQLYSFLGYSVLLYCALGRRRPLLLLPLLFLIWVNLHPFTYFGLIALTVIMLPPFVNGNPAERRNIAILWLCCGVATCITPTGLQPLLHSLPYVSKSALYSELIAEWRSPFQSGGVKSPLYSYAIILFILSALTILVRNVWQKTYSKQLTYIILGAITLVMSLNSRRFIPLFAISESLVIAALLSPISSKLPLRYTIFPPILAIGLGITLIAPFPIDSYAFSYIVNEGNFPVEICNFIETNKLSGNVFAQYNMASYVMFRSNGRMKVFIDGRAGVVYSDEIFRRYMMVERKEGDWINVIERSGADYVLWPKGIPKPYTVLGVGILPQQLIETGRWRLLYEDSFSSLLVRSDKTGLQNLISTAESPWRELAQGNKLFDNHEFPLSESYFEKALELMPYSEVACYYLADSQLNQGKYELFQETKSYCYKKYPPVGRDIPFLRKSSMRAR